MASQVFDEPEQGRTEGLRLRINRTSLSTRQRPRRARREAGDDAEGTRRTGPVSAVRMLAEASIRRIESLPGAGRKIPTHRPTQDINLEADTLGRTQRRIDHPCRHGTVQACHCLPEDRRPHRLPGEARSCSSPGGIATTLRREATADPCRGDLRRTAGRGKPRHQSWDLGWRQFRA